MALGTIKFLFITSFTVSEATADLLALFQRTELLANEFQYTLFDAVDVERNLSTSLQATGLRVCAAHLRIVRWQIKLHLS